MMSDREQYQCLNLLDYLSDLFTASTKASFTPTEILIFLDHVRTDFEIFDPLVVVAQQIATAETHPQLS